VIAEAESADAQHRDPGQGGARRACLAPAGPLADADTAAFNLEPPF
jgi:hypothetical protein